MLAHHVYAFIFGSREVSTFIIFWLVGEVGNVSLID
jgi:hypothetical protein